MMRWALTALVVLGFGVAVARADVLTGKVKSVDAEKKTVTVTVGDADRSFEMDAEARIFRTIGSGKKAKTEDVAGGLKGLEAGMTISFFTETKKGKEVITQIKVEGPAKKK